MSTVDVLLPHYGRLDLVRQTVRSVLAQEDPNWRLVIVDDSGDATDDALARWCEEFGDPRLRYVRNERNLGINRNFQRCVTLVESELAVVIGSDDLMLPNYVETVRRAARQHPEAAIIQPGVQVVGGDGRPVRTLADVAKRRVYAPRVAGPTVLSGEDLAAGLLRGNWLYFPSLCWRAEPLRRNGFRDGLSVVQDLALVLDLVLDGESLLAEPVVCFRYRRHRASVSQSRAVDGRRFAEERAFFLETAQRLQERGWDRAAAAARRHRSSRLNALTQVPAALLAGGDAALLARHALGRGTGPR